MTQLSWQISRLGLSTKSRDSLRKRRKNLQERSCQRDKPDYLLSQYPEEDKTLVLKLSKESKGDLVVASDPEHFKKSLCFRLTQTFLSKSLGERKQNSERQTDSGSAANTAAEQAFDRPVDPPTGRSVIFS